MIKKCISLFLIFCIFLQNVVMIRPVIYAKNFGDITTETVTMTNYELSKDIDFYVYSGIQYMDLEDVGIFTRTKIIPEPVSGELRLYHGIRTIKLILFDKKGRKQKEWLDGDYKGRVYFTSRDYTREIDVIIRNEKILVPSFPFLSLFGAECEYNYGIYYVKMPAVTIWEVMYDTVRANADVKLFDTVMDLENFYGNKWLLKLNMASCGVIDGYYEIDYSSFTDFITSSVKGIFGEQSRIEGLYEEMLNLNILEYESAKNQYETWGNVLLTSIENQIQGNELISSASNLVELLNDGCDAATTYFFNPMSSAKEYQPEIFKMVMNEINTMFEVEVEKVEREFDTLSEGAKITSSVVELASITADVFNKVNTRVNYSVENRQLFRNVFSDRNLKNAGLDKNSNYVKAAKEIDKKVGGSEEEIWNNAINEGVGSCVKFLIGLGEDKIVDLNLSKLMKPNILLQSLNIVKKTAELNKYSKTVINEATAQMDSFYLATFQQYLVALVNAAIEKTQKTDFYDRETLENLRQVLLLYCKATIVMNNKFIVYYANGLIKKNAQQNVIKNFQKRNEYLALTALKLSNSKLTLLDKNWKGTSIEPWNDKKNLNNKDKGLNQTKEETKEGSILSEIVNPDVSKEKQNVDYQTVTDLKENKVYSVDLNMDGTKEKVFWYNQWDEEAYRGDMYLSINGMEYNISDHIDYVLGYEVAFTDFYTDDSRLDISIVACAESNVLVGYYTVQYDQDENVHIRDGGKNIPVKRLGVGTQISYVRGNGEFEMVGDTPYYNLNFGCYYVDIPVRIDAVSGEVFLQEVDEYVISKSEYYEKGYQYELNKKMYLYEEPSVNSAEKEVLGKGTKFIALSIKPGEKSDEYSTELYVKIKTSSGKIGWLYFPVEGDYENPYLKEIPGWA